MMIIKKPMIKKIFVCSLFLICLYGCSSSIDPGFKFATGTYHFKMSDSLGSPIADGIINVKSTTNNQLTGTYDIKNIYQKDFPGLGVMDGEFSGEVNTKEKQIFINTNPRIADSNVFWYLNLNSGLLSGVWTHSTFRGPSANGKVEIAK